MIRTPEIWIEKLLPRLQADYLARWLASMRNEIMSLSVRVDRVEFPRPTLDFSRLGMPGTVYDRTELVNKILGSASGRVDCSFSCAVFVGEEIWNWKFTVTRSAVPYLRVYPSEFGEKCVAIHGKNLRALVESGVADIVRRKTAGRDSEVGSVLGRPWSLYLFEKMQRVKPLNRVANQLFVSAAPSLLERLRGELEQKVQQFCWWDNLVEVADGWAGVDRFVEEFDRRVVADCGKAFLEEMLQEVGVPLQTWLN